MKHGDWTEWYPSGKARSSGKYVQNQPDGKLAFWYEDGSKWAIKTFAKGQKHGAWLEWDQAGKLVKSEKYDKGELVTQQASKQ